MTPLESHKNQLPFKVKKKDIAFALAIPSWKISKAFEAKTLNSLFKYLTLEQLEYISDLFMVELKVLLEQYE